MIPRVLIIAGSDPSGGAGIQADIKTVTALGGYAMTAITALSIQDTTGVREVMTIPAEFVRKQIEIVLADIGADAIKIGMIGDKDTAYEISGALDKAARHIPKVLDPVFTSTSGDALAKDGVREVIYHEMMHQAGTLLTPNVDELSALTGLNITNSDELLRAGRKLREWSSQPMLLKGGHVDGDEIIDILLSTGSVQTFRNPRISSTSTHGTGCTLASAIATGLARGLSIRSAVPWAIDYVRTAIATAPGLGKGHGPLNHGHTVADFMNK